MPRNLSEAAKTHAAEKQARDFSVLACSAKKAEANAFRAWCAERGLSVHAALLEYVKKCIEDQAGA
jgi:hypothetical protein